MTYDTYGQAFLEVATANNRQLKPFGDLALAALAAKPGERVLDIGCGTAETAVQIGKTVGPSGLVLGIDLSPLIVEEARNRVKALSQVEVVQGDAQTYRFQLGHYDAVFSRFGVMAFRDPIAAFSNFRSALKATGRIAFVCWQTFEENELDFLPYEAARPYIEDQHLEPLDMAVPFSFSNPEFAIEVLHQSGFGNVSISGHSLEVSAGGIEETLRLCLRVGALGRVLRRSPELTQHVRAAVLDALSRKMTAQGAKMAGRVWLCTAQAA